MYYLIKDNKVFLSSRKSIINYLEKTTGIQHPLNIFDVWTEDYLKKHGIYKAEDRTEGTPGEFKNRQVKLDYNAQVDHLYRRTIWTNVPVTQAREKRKEEIAAIRYRKEISGYTFTHNDVEHTIDTDDRSQTKMTASFIIAQSQTDDWTINWKTKDGTFIQLTKNEFLEMCGEVFSWVNGLFEKERNARSSIDERTLTNLRNNSAQQIWDSV